MNPWQIQLQSLLNKFLSDARPVVDQDPVLFDLEYVDQSLSRFITNFDQATAEHFFYPAIAGYADAVNRLYGSSITVQGAPPAPPSTVFHEPTVEEVAAAGPFVDFSTVDPEVVGAAAAASPDSAAAAFLSEEPEATDLVPEDSPVDPPPAPPPPPTPAIDAPTIQPVGTVQDTSIALKLGNTTQLPQAEIMAAGNDSNYTQSDSTFIPTPGIAPVQHDAWGNLLGGLGAALPGIIGGQPIGQIIGSGLQGSGLLPTPGVAGPTNGNGGPTTEDLLRQLLAVITPGGNVLGEAAQVGDTAINMIGQQLQALLGGSTGPNGVSVGAPVGTGLMTRDGMPVMPITNTTPTVVHRSPPGYVTVELLGSNGQPVKVAMRKELARKHNLYRSRPKPPISAKDWKALKTANRVQKKAKTIASTAGYSCRLK